MTDEILAEYPEDIGGRLAPTEKRKLFKGLEGQVVFDPDDQYRPYVCDAETYGGHGLAFIDEVPKITDPMDTVRVTASTPATILDISLGNNFIVDLNTGSTTLSINVPGDLSVNDFYQLRLTINFTNSGSTVKFPSNVYFSSSVSDDQLEYAQKMANNQAGDVVMYELFTMDGGSTWLSRPLGYWSK